MNESIESRDERRLWIVTEQYYPQETATGYLLTQLAESIAQHQPVAVICGKPGRAIVGMDVAANEIRNKVAIHRCVTTSLNKDRFFTRLINTVTQTVSMAMATLRRVRKGDVVLVVTNPPTLPFLISLTCQLKGVHTILLIYDVYPDAAIAAGLIKGNGLLAHVSDYLNRLLYRSVQSIVVLGRDMRKQVLRKLQGHQDYVDTIPNWADIDLVYPSRREDNPLLKELGLASQFVVQYAGNMSRVNDLESIIECATQLHSLDDIHFLFLGSGAKQQWLERTVAERGLSNVTYLASRPRREQNIFLNACDVALVSLVEGMYGVSVPSRTYNIMAAGRPIIGLIEEETEVALLIEEHRIGWVVPPGQRSVLVQTVMEAYSHPERLLEMGQRSRHAAEQYYTLERATKQYLDVIASQ